ncbi:sulfatase : Uncharacterized protein OS=Pirellula staleyi (strain ATCC 27377 / DSM 6068 / ICPB 4128) GN=Psta_3494 PE=4 SV=1: DUF1501 [Gemmata massiliana]|uniref:Sulfatase n=1 Tax=Gemmata massiliana TaxID=1210884 RepID=A0A6P2DK85_9BACT|nr:DUF1501 domain-containing protein [Gemmata massiliana]VTS02999.1 sulfatase : Uncharacterized protein OS=Pirellula staleyi (strain ATCC 27377 / DSM 6068 / ICPB 4128) GN=Psta_3494 PE=4 SV=1: DUF1501 [Gemmata massiliana]
MRDFGISRRDMLKSSGTGLGVLGLAGILANEARSAPVASANPLAPKVAHFPAKAKHVIHLFMNGGPSQVDTFDPKPELTKQHGKQAGSAGLKTERKTGALYKSPFSFKKYGQSGIEVSEIFPEIGACIDDICVVRSMHTNIPNHEPGLLLMTCGNTQPIRPSMGSWLTYGLGTENQNLPGFVVLCPGKPVVGPALWNNSFLPGVFQGCHIQNLDPKKVIEHIRNTSVSASTQREQLDLLNQLNGLHKDKRGSDDQLDARIQSLEIAYRMQTEAQEAFDVNREPVKIRDAYGKGYFADACLTARRLVERGVRMVQVFYGSGQPWDDHGEVEKGHRAKAKDSDKAVAALLRDLKQTGLLDETLVLWGGEFGRTPTSEGASGRDHNNHGFSVWMAGGGVKGGMTYGATDEFGFAAVDKKVHIHDLHATILHLMGIDHEKLTYRYSGRDFRLTDVAGTVVKDILK